MKIYFAGAPHSTESQLRSYGVKNKLYSYVNELPHIVKWGNKGLMLDSGAFSVFTKGAKVNIRELTDFIKHFKPEYAIQLDVIGDEEKTWNNYLYMRKEVDNILPVIHFKSSDKHIERVISESNYILLGGLVPLTKWRKNVLISWLDYLYSKYGLQHKKIHLLGITTKDILMRYPAYSVDSTSWLGPSRYPVVGKNNMFINQKKKDYRKLEQETIRQTLELQDYITKLWESRGVKWD